MTGGPLGTPDTKITSGKVTAVRSDGLDRTVLISAAGSFTLKLPAGTWTLTASTPQYNRGSPCGAAAPLHVTSGQDTSYTLACQRR